jgi:aminocarboxymuconate-semialdehyde decarboxylase
VIIDMHTHIVPENFPEAGQRASADRWPWMDHTEPGRANVMIAGRNFRTVTDQCWSHTRRTSDLGVEGADMQVISPMPELLSYWFTPDDGLDMARFLNDYIAKLVQAAPDRLYGLGTVPMQDPELAAKELANVKAGGLDGIELGSNILGKSLGEERFHPFFGEVERLGLAVFVHALHPTFMDRIVGPESLDNPIGFPMDTGLTIASLITAGVLEKFPNLRLAFSHGGGTFPFFLPRLNNSWTGSWNDETAVDNPRYRAMRALLPKPPSEYARALYYDTLLFDGRAIRFLIEMMGHRQVLVGTDYPFIPREKPLTKTLRSLGLPEEQWEDITWRNTLRWLGREAPAS